jgi:hypothetical protein
MQPFHSAVRMAFPTHGDQKHYSTGIYARSLIRVRERTRVKTEKNKRCEWCGEGKMTCHETSAYFTLPVLIVPLQNYSIVITSPTHCRHSDVLRLMVSAWEGVAGVQPAVHSPFYVDCCSQLV